MVAAIRARLAEKAARDKAAEEAAMKEYPVLDAEWDEADDLVGIVRGALRTGFKAGFLTRGGE
jgi:hypothetical protein